MSRIRFTIDDVVEMNERMIGYYGKDISVGCNCIGDDLEVAKCMASIIEELVNDLERKEFKYDK